MLTERDLATLCGCRPDLSDSDLADLVEMLRPAAMWAWIRLGRPADPPHGPLGVALRRRLAQDLVASVRLRAVVAVLARGGLEPVLLKGAALSHGVYPFPWLRPRNDDDLLVSRERFADACLVLDESGYTREPANPGWEQTGQAHFTRVFAGGDTHHVDLHWRALVPMAFAALPGYDTLRVAGRPMPALGPGVWQPAAVHALVMACAHRVAHHAPDEDPMWLVDVHLLAGVLDEEAWDALVETARGARVAAVCGFELTRAAARLGTHVPARVRASLMAVSGEPSERHLRARGRLHRLWIDLGDRPEGRWRGLVSRVWPSKAYMSARYGRSAFLPVAYVWRAGAGAASWLAEAARRAWPR